MGAAAAEYLRELPDEPSMTVEDEKKLLDLRLREAGANLDKLSALRTDLAKREELWVRPYLIRVIQRQREARSRLETPEARQMAAAASSYGLREPDGRWLYQYKLADEMFARLGAEVRSLADRQPLEEASVAAGLFVLWASEWFRRCHPGGMLRWQDLEEAIGIARLQQSWRDTTKRGLEAWQRPVISGANARFFLGTLAREGGFPSAAINQEHRGWASAVLQGLVGALLIERAPDEEVALEFARSLAHRLPLAFSDEDFLVLCADLALAIVRLRSDAEIPAAAAGLPVSAWLDIHQCGWRDLLPIRADAPAAAALLDQLMEAEARPIARGELSASRVLRREGGIWREWLRLHLEGAVGASAARILDGAQGRLHLFAAGELARYVPGELASVQPPTEESPSWVSSSSASAMDGHEVPFHVRVELDARSESRGEGRIAVQGGAPVRSKMLVFTVAGRDEDGPSEFLLRGTGSGNYRDDTFGLRTPADWRVIEAGPDESVSRLGETDASYVLWLVAKGAVVLTPEGDRYRVLGGQPAERKDRIEVLGSMLPVLASPDPEVEIYNGGPAVTLCHGGRRMAAAGQLFLRKRDGWVPAPTPLPEGCYELGWRDSGILRDRVKIAVVPAAASVKITRIKNRARFELAGWRGCSLVPPTESPILVTSAGDTWVGKGSGEISRTLDADIVWHDDGSALPVRIPFPVGAGICTYEGKILRPRQSFVLGDLDRLLAYADGSMVMFARLRDKRGLRVFETELEWSFDGEMPLSAIADDISNMLGSAEVGSRVELGMHDGIEDYWSVKHFDKDLQADGHGFVSSRGVVEVGTRVCGRALARPAEERDFGGYSLAEEHNHKPFQLPPNLAGSWLIYLRLGGQVVSRPLIHLGSGRPPAVTNELEAALSLPPSESSCELQCVLAKAGTNAAAGASLIHYLNRLVVSLDGLPPTCLSLLQSLAGHPRTLARMAFLASTPDRAQILKLQAALPFAWYLIDRRVWQEAEHALFDDAMVRLSQQGIPAAEAPRYALQMVMAAKLDLIKREPLLGPLLGGSVEPQDLRSVVQHFLNRNIDGIRPAEGSIFRDELGHKLPSYFLELPDRCLEILDAPCAAALAALGEWAPPERHVRRIKFVSRAYPAYFEGAFGVLISENARDAQGW